MPLLYLVFPAINQGGYRYSYAIDHLFAHWAAVAAVILIIVALGYNLITIRNQVNALAERTNKN